MKVINVGLQIDLGSLPSTASLKRNPQFKRAVEDLFGTSHPRVVQAVEGFLKRRPGDLDHHRLRFIAAAASTFDDPNHVGYMIDRLPTTQTNVALMPLDIETARQRFEVALSRYRPETARKLVLDLVQSSTLQILLDMPADRVGEGGQLQVEAELLKKINGGVDQVAEVFRSDHLSSRFADAVLDQAEAKIIRAETGADGSPSRRPSYDEVHQYLEIVLGDRLADKVENRQLERVWQLFERCAPSDRSWTLLALTATKPQMVIEYGERILDGSTSSPSKTIRGDLLKLPELPEHLAMRAVAEGAMLGRHHRGDGRLYLVRQARYNKSTELLPTMTSDELDLAFAQLDTNALQTGPVLGAIAAIKNPEALELLVDRSPTLDDDACSALVQHPAMTPELVRRLVDNHLADISWARHQLFAGRLRTILTNPAVDDTRLLAIALTAVHDNHILSMQRLEVATHNSSAGKIVFDRLMAAVDDLRGNTMYESPLQVLARVARETPSPHLHSAFANLALSTGDETIAQALMSNGTIRNDTWQELRQRFTANNRDIVVGWDTHLAGAFEGQRRFPPYTARDVARLVISGDAAPGRADAIVRALLESPNQAHAASEIAAVSMLANAGMLSERAQTLMTGCNDRHIALEFASRPDFESCTSAFRQLADSRLTATAEAIARDFGSAPPEKGLRSWDQLQSLDDLPLPPTPIHELIDGRQIRDVTLRVVRTRRELNTLASEMGNCLDGYGDLVERCSNVVAFADDGTERYAVMWSVDEQSTGAGSSGIPISRAVPSTVLMDGEIEREATLRLVEINSKRNERRVPEWFEQGVRDFTVSVNNGTVEPVITPEPVSNSDDVAELPAEPARRRPPQRRPIPDLTPPLSVDDRVARDISAEHDTPSLLGVAIEAARSDDSSTASAADEPFGSAPHVAPTSTPDHGFSQ